MSKMIRAALATVVCSVPLAANGDEELPDDELLQGTWVATEVISSGTPLPKELLKEFQVEFSGPRFKLSPFRDQQGQPIAFRFELDATSNLRAIDLVKSDDDEPMRGLYRLDGDSLTLCVPATSGLDRPSELAAPAASGLMLIDLQRVISAPAGGIIRELPPDGGWVRFAVVGETKEPGRTAAAFSGTLTIRSVGSEIIDGEPCRWIEIETAIEHKAADAPGSSGIFKLLIPEKHLSGAEDPRQHVLRARKKVGDRVVNLMVEGADAGAISRLPFMTFPGTAFDEFFHAPLPEVGKMEWVRLETPVRRLVCRLIEARKPASPGGSTEVTTKTWLSQSIPFGVAQYRYTRSLGSGRSRTVQLTVTQTGDDAKSAIPD